MYITVEISYYPLTEKYDQPVFQLLEILNSQPQIVVEPGTMSTLIRGEYDEVMSILNTSMKELMRNYPSVFNLKIANACELKS